jgi:hypothetical protein
MLEDLKKSVENKINIFNQIEECYKKSKFECEVLDKKISDNKSLLESQTKNISLYEKSKEIINNIILKTRNEAIEFIENIVNCALQDVFGNNKLKLKLILKTECAKTSISTFIEENGELYDIESGRGGGLRDLVSTAILLCCRAMAKPKIECPLLLDESFKFLHSTKENQFKRNAFLFLQNVAKKLDTQIILITGETDKDAINAADNVLYIYKKNNESFLGKL